MIMIMQNVKGTNDYFGKEQVLRKRVQAALRDMFELYDFEEVDTAIVNELDFLTSKYAGGEEIVKEVVYLGVDSKHIFDLLRELVHAVSPSAEQIEQYY